MHTHDQNSGLSRSDRHIVFEWKPWVSTWRRAASADNRGMQKAPERGNGPDARPNFAAVAKKLDTSRRAVRRGWQRRNLN